MSTTFKLGVPKRPFADRKKSMRIVFAAPCLALLMAGPSMTAAKAQKFVNAACAPGFTAAPSKYETGMPNGLSYTCTGPAAVCSNGFTLQPLTVGTPGSTPGSLGSSTQVPAVAIKNGKMVYICAEPPKDPQ